MRRHLRNELTPEEKARAVVVGGRRREPVMRGPRFRTASLQSSRIAWGDPAQNLAASAELGKQPRAPLGSGIGSLFRSCPSRRLNLEWSDNRAYRHLAAGPRRCSDSRVLSRYLLPGSDRPLERARSHSRISSCATTIPFPGRKPDHDVAGGASESSSRYHRPCDPIWK